MEALENLSGRQKSFLLFAWMREGERAEQLIPLLSETQRSALQRAFDAIADIPSSDREGLLQVEFQSLQRSQKESLLKHADAGWWVESFKGESSRILAIVLQELPKAKIGRILKDLPKEARKALKTTSLAKIPYPILQLIRRRCEERFPLLQKGQLKDLGWFEQALELNADQILRWMRDVGLNELSIAFSKINRAATRAILHRLNMKDAKALRDRIKTGGDFPLEVQREAQMNILSLELEKLKPEEMAVEIGFSVLSRAFGKDFAHLVPVFIFKLPPHYGYILKRYADQNASALSLAKVMRVRERLAAALQRLEGSESLR